MPYRVLMIAPTSFFLDYGSHVRIREEARILQKLHHRVKIVTYPFGRNLSDLDIERALGVPWQPRHPIGPARSKLILDIFLALKALWVTLRWKPDIIHAHLHEAALIGGMIAWLRRTPLVFDLQGSLTSELVDHRFITWNGLLFKIAYWAEKRIDQLPRIIMTSSQNAANGLTNEFEVSKDRVMVVLDSVQADTFAPIDSAQQAERVEALRTKLQIPRDRKIVVYIGLLDEYRGTSVMLQAAADLLQRGVDAHFVIIGFPNIERYRTLARDLGVGERTSFPGGIPYEEVPLWLSLGDVAVDPKMSATEAAGKVPNYMSMGLPVVVFDIPVMREYLGDLGVYAPLGDSRALADRIKELLDDPCRARELGTKLRERAREKFSWEGVGRQIETVYDQALEI